MVIPCNLVHPPGQQRRSVAPLLSVGGVIGVELGRVVGLEPNRSPTLGVFVADDAEGARLGERLPGHLRDMVAFVGHRQRPAIVLGVLVVRVQPQQRAGHFNLGGQSFPALIRAIQQSNPGSRLVKRLANWQCTIQRESFHLPFQ